MKEILYQRKIFPGVLGNTACFHCGGIMDWVFGSSMIAGYFKCYKCEVSCVIRDHADYDIKTWEIVDPNLNY